MKTCIDSTNKQIVSKMQPIFVASVTKCTDDAEPATRDKALNVLLSFCIKVISYNNNFLIYENIIYRL